MNKRNKKILCLIALLNIFTINTKAATLAISDDTTSAGENNKSVSVEIKDNDLNNYVKVEFELSISGTSYASFEFKPKPIQSGLKYDGTDNKYTFEVDESLSTSELYATNIGSISYKTTENLISEFKIVPTNVKFTKKDGTVVKVGEDNVRIDEGIIHFKKPKSNNATLTELTVSQGKLSPEFNKDITEYSVIVPDTINMLKIIGTTAPGATRVGTGNKTLNMGENVFTVEVTAEDGVTKKIYKINVNRGEIEKPSAYLKSLVINNIGCNLSPEFDKQNNKYTVSATPDIKELDIRYESEDPAATVTIDGNEDLGLGENLVTIKVKSSDEKEEQTYELIVNISEKEEESKEEIIPPIKKADKKKNKWLLPVIISIVFLIVILVAILLFKNKKPKKTKKITLKEEIDDNSDFIENEIVEPKPKKEEPALILGDIIDSNELEETTIEIKNDNLENIDLEKTKEFNLKDFK